MFQSFGAIIAVFSFFSFFIFPSASFANDSAYGGDGANVYIVDNPDIQMVKEEVRIFRISPERLDSKGELKYGGWKTLATFWFKNLTDKAIDVQMGFPDWKKIYPGSEDEEEKGKFSWAIKHFKSIVDGEPVKTEHKLLSRKSKGDVGEGAYLWNVSFKPFEEKILKSEYQFGGDINSIGGEEIKYILMTGKSWAQNIESADIVVEFSKNEWPGHIKFSPVGCIFERGKLAWHFENFKPMKNVEVELSSPRWCAFATIEDAKDWIGRAKKGETSKEVVSLVKNGIYAHYGRPFKDRNLRDYFKKQNCYNEDPSYQDLNISADDKAIIKMLADFEKEL